MTTRHSFLLLMIAIVFASAEQFLSDNVFPDKRRSMGLQGIRGKKSLASWDHDRLSKRAPMGFQGMRGKKSSIIADVENELFPEDIDKRAPMGFQGVRGKKDYVLSTNDFGDTYLHDDYEKRAPMSFQSTRGKKTSTQDEYYKRAPMGFQGMRGKKSFDLTEILDRVDRRTTAKHADTRNKETYSLEYPDDYDKTSLPMDAYPSIRDKKVRSLREWEKKAPMGFQGMRGKKMILDTLEQLDKRAVMDFNGKKNTFDHFREYSTDPADYEKRDTDLLDTGRSGESFKRMEGARLAFRGTRIKRDATDSRYARTAMDNEGTSERGNDLAAYEIEKRSPFAYLPVRGKKNPRWEFRGKFVGVRGKKLSGLHTVGQGQPVF